MPPSTTAGASCPLQYCHTAARFLEAGRALACVWFQVLLLSTCSRAVVSSVCLSGSEFVCPEKNCTPNPFSLQLRSAAIAPTFLVGR